jgi:hypothetical protein
VLGILGNLLLIIPGIMACRFKPESASEIKPQSKEEGGIAAPRYKPESASEIKPQSKEEGGIAAPRYKPESASEIKSQSKEEGEKVILENKTKTHLIIVIAIIASVSFGIILVMSFNQMNQNSYDAISGIPSSTPSYGEIQQTCYDKIKEQGLTEPTETAVNICAGMVMDSLNK